MKTIFIALFTLISTVTIAQNTVTWKGGTPGKETSWNEARNWSNNRVPDEFSDVIIPDVSTTTFATPIISEGTVELNSILIESNALLTIEAYANLVIHGFAEGLYKDNLDLKGTISLLDEVNNDYVMHFAALSNKN